MKKRMAFATVNALMAIFALASFPTMAQAGDPPPGEPHPIYSAEQTELADAEVIAKMQEVTTDRALARIRSQKLISELSESIMARVTEIKIVDRTNMQNAVFSMTVLLFWKETNLQRWP